MATRRHLSLVHYTRRFMELGSLESAYRSEESFPTNVHLIHYRQTGGSGLKNSLFSGVECTYTTARFMPRSQVRRAHPQIGRPAAETHVHTCCAAASSNDCCSAFFHTARTAMPQTGRDRREVLFDSQSACVKKMDLAPSGQRDDACYRRGS